MNDIRLTDGAALNATHCHKDPCSGCDGCECPCLGCDVEWHERRREFLRESAAKPNDPAPALNMDAVAGPYETLRGVAAELLDPATAAAMLATALRYPLHLAADVALPVVEAVERAWCRLDSAATHWAWLLSFLGYGGAL